MQGMETARQRIGTAALGALLSGCYAELTGGMYAVTGANEATWRAAPAFGISAGFAYDAFVARASLGGGGEAMYARVAGTNQVVVAGPVVARLELSPARIGTRGLFRIAAGVAAGAAQRFRTAPDASGVVEGRPTQALQVSLVPSTGWVLSGGRLANFLVLDVGLGPAGFVSWDNPGLTNLYAVGGTARVTLSLPLTYGDGLAIGAGIESWSRAMNTPEARERAQAEFMADWQNSLEQSRARMTREREQGEVSTCPSGTYTHDSSYNLRCVR